MAAKRLYEGMFLVDSALAAADWDGMVALVENILKRADAEVVVIRKWGERKLAYDIDHKPRGTYILVYFNVDPRRVSGIEKDVQLSEKVMRVLILTTEGRPQEMIDQDIAGVTRQEVPEVAAETESPVRRRGLADADEAESPRRRRSLADADEPEDEGPAGTAEAEEGAGYRER